MNGLPLDSPPKGYTNVWHRANGANHLPHPTATFSVTRGCSLTLCGIADARTNTVVRLDEKWAMLCPRCARLRAASQADVPEAVNA